MFCMKLKNKKLKIALIQKKINNLSKDEYDMLLLELNENTARFKLNNLIKNLFEKQKENNFHRFQMILMNYQKIIIDFSIITSVVKRFAIQKISHYITDNKGNLVKL